MTGDHCHPHAARHCVAHMLFAEGNPVALIAKFLGHRSISTTDRYYLRLSFEEMLQRIRLPVHYKLVGVSEENKKVAAAVI